MSTYWGFCEGSSCSKALWMDAHHIRWARTEAFYLLAAGRQERSLWRWSSYLPGCSYWQETVQEGDPFELSRDPFHPQVSCWVIASLIPLIPKVWLWNLGARLFSLSSQTLDIWVINDYSSGTIIKTIQTRPFSRRDTTTNYYGK